MPSYAVQDYFLARIPDFQTVLPVYPIAPALSASMALYWDRFLDANGQPLTQPMDESQLSERQKVIVALRSAIAAVPVVTQVLTKPRVVNAKGGPAEAEFEELNKLLKALMPMWLTELKNLEAMENVFFDMTPTVPGIMQTLTCHSIFNDGAIYDPATGVWYLQGDN